MFSVLLQLYSFAYAVPLQMTQQGRLLDNTGASITGVHSLTFRIYDAQSNGTLLWSEALSVQFNNGYFATVLGTDEINNPLDSSTLEFYPIFLEIQVDQASPLSPRTSITSSPYAQIAGVAESVNGGTVQADSIRINNGGNTLQVVDSTGNWVGPAISVSWNDIDPTSIPADIANGDDNTQLSESQVENYVTNGALSFAFGSSVQGGGLILTETSTLNWNNIDVNTLPNGLADGDDDTLASLSCAMGEIAGWNGASWVCTSDNTLDLAGLQTMLQNNAVDLNAGSTIGGVAILTSVDDNDTLGSLSCANDGEIAKYDIVTNSWYCDMDGFDEATLIATIENRSTLTLHANTTLAGNQIISAPPNCQNGQILSFDSNANTWNCIDFSTIIDQDSDGVLAWNDCNDNDASAGSSINDTDCDGVIATDDCNDGDANSTIIATDGDCDGVLTLDDCDDNNANSTIVATDGDCDTVLTADDCDDGDSNSTIRATDADCDTILTADDCDDNNANLLYRDGSTSSCPGFACLDILNEFPASVSGTYYINLGQSTPILSYCDMNTNGGGWTVFYAATGADGEAPLTSNSTRAGNPLSFQHHNVNQATKVLLSSVSSETLFYRSNGAWIKASSSAFNSTLTSSNQHAHTSVTLTASNGTTASGFMGWSTTNIAGGGDFNLSQTDGTTCSGGTSQGVDHHSSSYYHLNCGCERQYLYSYSNSVGDADAGYDVNTSLGSWTGTNGCDSAEGGALTFYVGMR